MPSADDLGQFLQKHDCAPPLMPEKDTSEEGAGKNSLTESSELDDEGSVDGNGVTTLMEAAKRNDVDAVKRYIPYQARMVAKLVNVGGINIYEGTALMVAAVLGHAEVVRLLRKHESCMRSSNEWTALMWAAFIGHAEVVRLLLRTEGGMKKGKGCTALTVAAGYDHLDCVRLLLEREKNVGGESAIRMANRWNHSRVVSLLESNGIRLVDPYLRIPPKEPVNELA